MNFARNFADDLLLPWEVDRIVYLDSDTIVHGDIIDLFSTRLDKDKGRFFAHPRLCKQTNDFWFNFRNSMVSRTLRPRGCAINAGVFVLDLVEYRREHVQQTIAKLIENHERSIKKGSRGLWNRGVHQPSFALALANYSQEVDARWNVGQLGFVEGKREAELRDALVLHWNGHRKPWLPKGLYSKYWLRYAIPLPAPPGSMLVGSCLAGSVEMDAGG
eukprot:CAMPEP_0170134650 /NCGR_PEP_ID=MMETSP0033_2-20121228/2031_1 /TAXON_ID=195969 /ORGANISM="Dolichomastix tenuilepis, Strain CCMP3274" /LENGTH=216 /DNA_ID=CAMNT_0010370217 /DNA_START=115 /DNA_END=765 /DNA_ORIENTATION=-